MKVVDTTKKHLAILAEGNLTNAELKAGFKFTDRELASVPRLSKKWAAGYIERGTVKSQTMTFVYGSKDYAIRKMVMKAFAKQVKIGELFPENFSTNIDDAAYIMRVAARAIRDEVTSTYVVMEWLKKCAEITSKESLPIKWQLPSGFVVKQDYRKRVGQKVPFDIEGTRHQLTVRITTTKMRADKMVNALPANYVQSMDANHLMTTVDACLERGVEAFSMVHDSFGVLAGDAQTMYEELRKAFVEQYSGNLLEEFRENLVTSELSEELRVSIPPVPVLGDLDIADIVNCKYIFT